MKRINNENLKKLKLSDLIFNFSNSKEINEDTFSPKQTDHHEKYMIIEIETDYIKLSSDITFDNENNNRIIFIKKNDLVNNSWWIL